MSHVTQNEKPQWMVNQRNRHRIDVNGVGYDSEACELYVSARSQDSYGYEPGPLIHVFKVNNVAVESNPKPTPTTLIVLGTTPAPTPQPQPEPPPTPAPTPDVGPRGHHVAAVLVDALTQFESTLKAMVDDKARLIAIRAAVKALNVEVKAKHTTIPNWLEDKIADLLKL